MVKQIIDLEPIRREREGELIRRLSYYGELEELSRVIERAVWRQDRIKANQLVNSQLS